MTETRSIEARPVPPGKLAHFVVKTTRFEPVIDWYKTVLCARIVFQNAMIAFLSFDEEHHRLAVIRLPVDTPVSQSMSGMDHIAFTFDDLGTLLGTYRRLLTAGIAPARTINHGPTISFYYVDPEGLRVELQVYNFATNAEVTAFFHGAEFAENPIGVHVDPEKLLKDYEAGVPLQSLSRRPPLPPGRTVADMRRDNADLAMAN